MEAKIAQFTNKGMNQDISISKASNEFAYKNHNIRITAINDSTLLSITNEKGPLELTDIKIIWYKSNIVGTGIIGTLLGYAVLNDYIVLFTKHTTTDGKIYDRIYRIEINDNKVTGKELFKGDLNFSKVSHIETLPFYESDKVQKVYWVDGVNYPRVINIVREEDYNSSTDFDFVKVIDIYPKVSITKQYSGVGLFPSGVVQYFISYYNKFGAETNLVWASDLQYISDYNKGTSPEDNIVCSFNINVKNIDTSFDFIRLYSVIRTSVNATPIVKVVTDINISSEDTLTEINYIDTNTTGYDISIDNLLYLGLNKLIASTIEQKDNTLFLGNITTKDRKVFTKEEQDFIRQNTQISWDYKYIKNEDFQLAGNSESDIKTFKYDEIYRFALQFQDKELTWSEPIYIKDDRCPIKPYIDSDNSKIALPSAYVTLDNKVFGNFYEYKNWRVLIANPTINDRKVLAQGLVNPTIFNPYHRVANNGPYAIASPIARVRNSNTRYQHLEGLGSSDIDTYDNKAEIQGIYNKTPVLNKENDLTSYYLLSLRLYNNNTCYTNLIQLKTADNDLYSLNPTSSDIDSYIIDGMRLIGSSENKESIFEYILQYIKSILKIDDVNGATKENICNYINNIGSGAGGNKYYKDYYPIEEIDNKWYSGWFKREGSELNKYYNSSENKKEKGLYTVIKTNKPLELLYKEYSNNYYIDESIVTLFSPELEDNEYLFNTDLKFRPIGCIKIDSSESDSLIEIDPAGFSSESTVLKPVKDSEYNAPTLINDFLFQDIGWIDNTLRNYTSKYAVYLWNKSNSIIGQNSDSKAPDNTKLTTTYAKLKHKIFATRRYSNSTQYFKNALNYDIKPKIFNLNEVTLTQIDVNGELKTYSGNYDTILAFDENSKYNVYYKDISNLTANKSDQLDPISIKYDTSEHLVFSLGDLSNAINILPYNGRGNSQKEYLVDNIYPDIKNNNYIIPWDSNHTTYVFDEFSCNTPEEYLLLGEVYRDIDENIIYGGKSEEALKNNEWVPASEIVVFDGFNTSTNTFGDTYYQRYDCLLSYPSTEEDLNSVVDITSFMVETHKNLNGRYDANIDGFNLLNSRKTNFNKVNPVYSQQNNIFTYRILDSKFNEDKYSNQFVFSLNKSLLSDIDNWTKISTANCINLDGIYGNLTKIIKLNNNLITFQDKAISQINFNSRVALSTESGASVLLANSGKVDSTTIITNTAGCKNIKSICQTNTGIYFIDDEKKTLLRINGKGINNISSQGLTVWFRENLTGDEVISYDSITHDIYISNNNSCVVFNEDLQTFTSFYDYQKMQGLVNINGKSILLYSNVRDNSINLYSMFDGKYNSTVKGNTYRGYEMIYKINPEPYSDSTFTNIEFIADYVNDKVDESNTLNKSFTPFTTLDIWNEYQSGTTSIANNRYTYPNFINKFRVWRVDIPRDSKNHRDRIRNPWAMIKLSNVLTINRKMVFHSLLVKYYK